MPTGLIYYKGTMKRHSEQVDKLKIIGEGLKNIADVGLLDDFYDEIWIKKTPELLNKYLDEREYYDISREETDSALQSVVEWFGKDYGLAEMNGEFWMVSVGSVDEGGNKWWYKIKIKTEDLETARRVILLDKCLPGKYCNIIRPKD